MNSLTSFSTTRFGSHYSSYLLKNTKVTSIFLKTRGISHLYGLRTPTLATSYQGLRPQMVQNFILNRNSIYRNQFPTTSIIPPQLCQSRGVFSRGGRRKGSMFSYLPVPLQSFLPIVGIVGLLFFVAAPFIMLILPPLFLGGMLYMRRMNAIRKATFEKRWNDMASYHMLYQTNTAAMNEQEALKKMATRRVVEAVQDNEQGIAEALGFPVASNDSAADEELIYKRSHLALTDITGIEEDWRVSPQGIAQNMTVYTMTLVDKNRDATPIAKVNIVVKVKQPVGFREANKEQDVRIEVETLGLRKHMFVLDGPSNEAESDSQPRIIDVKSRKV